jgi:hypothetical protein
VLHSFRIPIASFDDLDLRSIASTRLGCLVRQQTRFGRGRASDHHLQQRHAPIMTLYALVAGAVAAVQPSWWDNPAFFLLFIPYIHGKYGKEIFE